MLIQQKIVYSKHFTYSASIFIDISQRCVEGPTSLLGRKSDTVVDFRVHNSRVKQLYGKMAAKRIHSEAGAVYAPYKPTPAIKRTQIPSYSLISTLFFPTCLLFLSTRQRIIVAPSGGCVCCPAPGSQNLLYSALLNHGQARMPPSSREQTKSNNVTQRLFYLKIIALLAGDVEVNPGPQPLDTGNQNYQLPQPTCFSQYHLPTAAASSAEPCRGRAAQQLKTNNGIHLPDISSATATNSAGSGRGRRLVAASIILAPPTQQRLTQRCRADS